MNTASTEKLHRVTAPSHHKTGAQHQGDQSVLCRGLSSRISISFLLLLVSMIFAWNIHYFYFLCDDSYISFRYARNLISGYGLVWNPGEFVEGYTNFLWVILMAISMKVGILPEVASNIIGITSGVMVLTLMAFHIAKQTSWVDPWLWILLLVLASSRSFTAWCTSGLETMFFTLLIYAAYVAFLSESARRSSTLGISSTLFALASLTRPEGGLFMFIGGMFFLFDVLRGRRSFKALVVWTIPYLCLVGGHVAWRFLYYGSFLPNTFHAKVHGAWLEQSFRYFSLFSDYYQIVWFLPFMVVALLCVRTRQVALYSSIVGLYLAYVAYVGGDRFEFRFLVVIFPYFYWLLMEGLRAVYQFREAKVFKALAILSSIALLVLTVKGSYLILTRSERMGVASIEGMRSYAVRRAEQGKFLKQLIERGVLSSDTVIGVGGAGALPYFAELETVDRRGLNDAYISQIPVEERGWIAHELDAPYDYLVERKVVIFDIFNRLIHSNDMGVGDGKQYFHDGKPVEMRALKVYDQYLVFASFVSDQELRQHIRGGRIIYPPRLEIAEN